MNKKVVVLGGGTGMSTLLRGIKEYPVDISAVVTVCDDGKSTGRLRKEFNTPAVGDVRRVLIALSETEPLVETLFNYRFETSSDLNGHTVGNLLLTAIQDIAGNMSDGVEALGRILNLKGKVLPLTEDGKITLMGKMKDGAIVEGEHNITAYDSPIEEVFYKQMPKVNETVIEEIKKADLIVLSMGSLYTSIIPTLICPEITQAINESKGKIMYVCNMMTQPGETDGFKASDHIRVLNQYLGNRQIDIVIGNDGKIERSIIKKYARLEEKDPVIFDKTKVKKMVPETLFADLVCINEGFVRYNPTKLAFHIFSYLID